MLTEVVTWAASVAIGCAFGWAIVTACAVPPPPPRSSPPVIPTARVVRGSSVTEPIP